MPSKWHPPKPGSVTCPLTSQIFTTSLLDIRHGQGPCCQADAHSVLWRAQLWQQLSVFTRANRGMPRPQCPRLLSPFPSLGLYRFTSLPLLKSLKFLNLLSKRIQEKHLFQLEKVSFHSNPKERQCQRMFRYRTIALISHSSKVMVKILQARLQ